MQADVDSRQLVQAEVKRSRSWMRIRPSSSLTTLSTYYRPGRIVPASARSGWSMPFPCSGKRKRLRMLTPE